MHRTSENFIALLKPVYSNAVKYCIALARNDSDAKDLFQESMLKAIQHFSSLNDDSKFKSWLFTIITREFYSMYRKSLSAKLFYKKYRPEITELPLAFESEMIDPRLPNLLTALNSLGDKSRAALVLFEIGDFSIEEIRQIQNEHSISAVKSRISRARDTIFKLMSENPVNK